MAKATCSIKDCERPARSRGWCVAHYNRWLRCGDVRADLPLRGQDGSWNHQKQLAAQRRYKEQNREAVQARSRERYQADPAAARAYRRSWHERNPAKQSEYNLRKLAKRRGMTVAEWDAMLIAQSGRCAICGTSEPLRNTLYIDHCHDSDVVRGLLCHLCNVLLGMAGDDLDVLRSAIEYLRSRQPLAFSISSM